MKRILFLTAVAVFYYGNVNAQLQVSFGAKAGLSGANVKVSSINTDTKFGFYAGVLAEIKVSENFKVQPELFYSQMGFKETFLIDRDMDEWAKAIAALDYINLPVLLKYNYEGFSAFIGPQVGYLLSAKAKTNSGTTDVKNSFESIDFSGVAGLGYTLPIGLGFDARYQLGFARLNKKNNEDDNPAKTRTYQVGLHYFFNRH